MAKATIDQLRKSNKRGRFIDQVIALITNNHLRAHPKRGTRIFARCRGEVVQLAYVEIEELQAPSTFTSIDPDDDYNKPSKAVAGYRVYGHTFEQKSFELCQVDGGDIFTLTDALEDTLEGVLWAE
jgi:hypothetical protein